MKKKSKKTLRLKADRLLQELGRKIGKPCFVCGGERSTYHHYYTKSCAGNLRYYQNNLIDLCVGCHFKHHLGNPDIHNIINFKKGSKWLDELMEARHKIIKKDTVLYYETIIEDLQRQLNE